MASQPAECSIANVFSNTFGVIVRNAALFLGLSLVIVGLPQLGMGLFVSPGAADPATVFLSPALLLS
ncbi:hypothetical protein E4877_23905, partial [Salmonella enterica subsp. enterica serovar Anatum]